MKYLSLFSGIGGFELGINQAYALSKTKGKQQGRSPKNSTMCRQSFMGAQCVGYSEIDQYATEVYQRRFPQHHNYGDITKIDPTCLPNFELLVGGFPCQSFSIAGKRGGFSDTRGTLFFEIARIIKERPPRLLLLENVKGLLSHDEGRTFTTIISTLDELGYDVQWQVLNSKNHGVPQNRERVYIVGHLRGTPRPEIFPITQNGGQADELQRHIPNTLTRRYEGAQAVGTYIGEGELNAQEIKHSNDRVYDPVGLSPTLNTMQGGNRQPFIRETKDGFHQYRNDKKKSSIQGTHVTYPNGNSHALNTAHIPMTNADMKIRRLTPMECERLQGFPDGWTEGVSDTQRYKCLGNAVTVNVVRDVVVKIL